MKEQATEAIRDFVSVFCSLHKEYPRMSYNTLNAAYVTCYSILSTDERIRCSSSLIDFLKDISDEKFEDGPDFISFLKEKAEEKYGELKND